MGQIIGGAAKPKRCNINRLSQLGTPAAGEHILVSSDNSMNAAGQGDFDCYVVGDGTTAATALELKNVETLIGVFDISSYHATGGVLAKYADLTAALNDGNNIPQSFRKGGMSVKFVQSSDNKYVQYMLLKDEFSTNTDDWTFYGNNVYIENPEWIRVILDKERRILCGIKTDGSIEWSVGIPTPVKNAINEERKRAEEAENLKVNVEEGKALIDAEFASSISWIEYPQFIGAWIDSEKHILLGIQDDGNIFFGAGVPRQIVSYFENTIHPLLSNKVDKEDGKTLVDEVVSECLHSLDNSEYLDIEVDAGNKILGGRRADGTKFENMPIETPYVTNGSAESDEYVHIVTDSEHKIIEGITNQGEKHISSFDAATKSLIRKTVGGVIKLPVVDSSITSVFNAVVTGEAGSENARYDISLPLSDTAYNIRFKFRITENLLNQNKSALIASVNGARVTAAPVPLEQCVAPISYPYQGSRPNVNWTTLYGGIKLNGGSISKKVCKQNIGQEAFSVKYKGESSATIANNGEAILLTIDSVTTTYSFTDYPTVSELFAAMRNNSAIELKQIAMDKRNCSELAVFSAVTLRDTFICDDKGSYGSSDNFEPEPRLDNPPFYLRYAVSNEWHQVEIVCIDGAVYNTCDGNVINVAGVNHNNILTLGGECGVLFKDIEISTDNSGDAEIHNGFIISSVNPYIAILEAHGLYTEPAYTATPEATSEGMCSMNIETLDYIFSDLRRKGYVPVSVKDIAQWCVSDTILPKKCYTIIFDDFRFPVCLDLEQRCVFNRYGVKPALALITSLSNKIYYDGNEITKQEACNICYAAGFDIVSHTHNHRSTYGLKPSQYREWLQKDIIDADKLGANGSIIVFPGGATDEYMGDVMEDVGIKCGIGIPGEAPQNNTLRNRFYLSRIDVSSIIKSDGSSEDYDTKFMNRIY